ncbi:IclR family transcriptional regulator [Bradyrhizobium sp. 14AA]
MAKSAVRVLEIMEFIAKRGTGPTHSEIAEELGIPKSSLTALMRDLLDMRYVRIDEATSRYELDSQCLILSQAFLRSLNIVRMGEPVVQSVFRETNEFTCLTIVKDTDVIVVCADAPPSPLAHSLQIGDRTPMYCSASGKVVLAFLDGAEAREILQRSERRKLTPTTKTDIGEIMGEFAKVRSDGCAYSHEETILGITACAVPVFNRARRPIASLSCAMASSRLVPSRHKQLLSVLKSAGAQLSEALGYRPEERAAQVTDYNPKARLKSSPSRTRRSISSSRSL